MTERDFSDQENESKGRSHAEGDDEFLGTDEFDSEDLSTKDPLSERFQGGGYRIVRLDDLVGSDDEAIVEEDLEVPAATMDAGELLRNLIEAQEELPTYELFALSDLSSDDVELVRRLWPLVPVERRRVVAETLVLSAEQFIDLQLGAFLRIALDDEDPIVRQTAVGGLWEDEGVDLLGRYVYMVDRDVDAAVRAAAAAALGPYVLAGELDEMDAALAMRAEEALIAAVTNPNELLVVQCRALESIAYSGELGVRQLIEDAYYSPYDEMRLSALIAMGRSADVRWRRLVRAELQSPAPEVRMEAALACGNLEARAALPELLDLLEDDDEGVRLAAIFALGRLGGATAREALEEVATSGDAQEVIAAEEALEEMLFYAGVEAEYAPLYEEPDPEDWDDLYWGSDQIDDEF